MISNYFLQILVVLVHENVYFNAFDEENMRNNSSIHV